MESNTTERSGSRRRNIGATERVLTGLAGAALVAYAFRRRSHGALALGAVGGGLLARAAIGFSPLYAATGVTRKRRLAGPLRARATITVDSTPEHLYAYWRNLPNVPLLVDHLERVTPIDARRSRWVAVAPGGRELTWEAEVVSDVPPTRIGWRSVTGSWLQMTGEVQLKPAPAGRGTEVHLALSYQPPGGRLGAVVAGLLGREPGQMLGDSLRRLKQAVEAGEIATTQGQSSARRRRRPEPFEMTRRAADVVMTLRRSAEAEVRP